MSSSQWNLRRTSLVALLLGELKAQKHYQERPTRSFIPVSTKASWKWIVAGALRRKPSFLLRQAANHLSSALDRLVMLELPYQKLAQLLLFRAAIFVRLHQRFTCDDMNVDYQRRQHPTVKLPICYRRIILHQFGPVLVLHSTRFEFLVTFSAYSNYPTVSKRSLTISPPSLWLLLW